MIQLVVQIKLQPFIEAKLDVVSGGGDVHNLSSQIRIIAGGNDSDRRSGDVDAVWHGARFDLPCSMRLSSATSLVCGLQHIDTYNMQRTSLHGRVQRTCMQRCIPRQCTCKCCTFAQAFSWGGYLPGLKDGAPAYIVVVIAAWVVISVGGCLTLMALAGEASFSVDAAESLVDGHSLQPTCAGL